MKIVELGEDGCEIESSGNEMVPVRAKKVLVLAGARLLFYPTLFYNVVRNKMQAEFRWWDEVDPVNFLFFNFSFIYKYSFCFHGPIRTLIISNFIEKKV
jgi:hypothetical protein